MASGKRTGEAPPECPTPPGAPPYGESQGAAASSSAGAAGGKAGAGDAARGGGGAPPTPLPMTGQMAPPTQPTPPLVNPVIILTSKLNVLVPTSFRFDYNCCPLCPIADGRSATASRPGSVEASRPGGTRFAQSTTGISLITCLLYVEQLLPYNCLCRMLKAYIFSYSLEDPCLELNKIA